MNKKLEKLINPSFGLVHMDPAIVCRWKVFEPSSDKKSRTTNIYIYICVCVRIFIYISVWVCVQHCKCISDRSGCFVS